MTLSLITAPSPNFNERLHKLDMLVFHYTGMRDGPSALARLQDPDAGVSAHYLVEEDGTIFSLVPEEKRAWHAGLSAWQGDDDLNSRSIGIEIVNGGHDFGLPDYPDRQISAVIELARGILERWPIRASRIVAHSDIAPSRKADPGERFPWRRLADAGVGPWPNGDPGHGSRGLRLAPGDNGQATARLQSELASIGYALPSSGIYDDATEAVVRAFQRRWRQQEVTGAADAGTQAWVRAIVELTR